MLIRRARDGAVVKSLACGQNLQANQMESSIEASPSIYVARIQTPVSTPYVGFRRRVLGWFSPLLREVFLRVSPGTPIFPSPKKPTFLNSNSTRNQVDEEPLCGCANSKSSFIRFNVFYLVIKKLTATFIIPS